MEIKQVSKKSKKSGLKGYKFEPSKSIRKMIQNSIIEIRRQAAERKHVEALVELMKDGPAITDSCEFKQSESMRIIKASLDKVSFPCPRSNIDSIQLGLQEMEVLQTKIGDVFKERINQGIVYQDKIDDLQNQMRVIRKANALRGYQGG